MSGVIFLQGEDANIELSIYKDGVPIYVSENSTVIQIKAELLVNNISAYTYSFNPSEGVGLYGSISLVDETLDVNGDPIPNNKFIIQVSREESANFPVGTLTARVSATVADDDYKKDFSRVVKTTYVCGQVRPGFLLAESIPLQSI